MKNENRAAFGRAPEPIDYAFDLPPDADGNTSVSSESAKKENLFTNPIGRIAAWLNRRRTAFALMDLNDEQLKDIGLSRCQAWGGYSRYRRSSAHDVEKCCL
ncbi:hypothetical protein D3C87_1435850 [compost metagenome]|uniref:DUF1127 domain-containing protein n=1 Tax=Rhizobium sp. ZW T2_16 TaxID=3378083 RepID=UPI000FA1F6AB